jgi:hypothetical protein
MVRRAGKTKSYAIAPGRRPAAPPAPVSVSAPAAAAAFALTQAQKSAIYRAIAEMPLQPKPVITEHLSQPLANAPDSGPATSGAAPPPVTETAPAVGEPVAPTVPLHPLPPGAVAAAPQIESYRYAFIGERVLLVDPATGLVVAAIAP